MPSHYSGTAFCPEECTAWEKDLCCHGIYPVGIVEHFGESGRVFDRQRDLVQLSKRYKCL